MNVEELKFDEKGLIPAVVIDDETGKLLTLAYMNRESLNISLEKGLTCFWSRSRQELWLKGETSGNYQHIASVTADCDGDALEVRVRKDGPACHTGAESCFHNPIFGEKSEKFQLEGLYQLLQSRKRNCRKAPTPPTFSRRAWTRFSRRWERRAPRSLLRARLRTRRRPSMRLPILPTMCWC